MKAYELIGNTPMYQLENTNIYIKLEKFNLGGSIKDRAVLKMIQTAMAENKITKDTVLIEATSGNTGIALAMIGAMFQIPVIIVMPETMSVERRQLVKAYGAKLVLSEGKLGMNGAIAYMEKEKQAHSNYRSLSQFDNAANVQAHYETTAEEILRQVPDVDIFVAGIGTGGTFTGVAKRLKEVNPAIRTIAGEPKDSAVLSGLKPGPHKIQGIGAGFIPSILDQDLIDDIMMVTNEEALEETKQFVRETGILIGISSGANIALAKRLADRNPNKKIVTVAPDGGEKYLSILDFGE